MVVHTMLYISNNRKGKVSENDSINIIGYLRCCVMLMESLKSKNINFVLLTNDKEFIMNNTENYINVEQIDIRLDVPEKIKFYGAHYKIDALEYIANLHDDKYHVLVDSDVICINNIPLCLKILERKRISTYYNITDQVFPAYGEKKIIKDKNSLMNNCSIGLWAGGEYLGGSCDFFDSLYTQCMVYWPRYKEVYNELHHQGDEMLISCAIEKLLYDGYLIIDAGKYNIVNRYWSVKTLHVSAPLNAVYDSFLVHLPADKTFLSLIGYFSSNTFPNDYIEYIRKRDKRPSYMKLLMQKIIRKIRNLTTAST